MTSRPRRLLSISHSYVVRLNRRLADEMARISNGRWEVRAVAPRRFVNSNDNRIIECQPAEHEACELEQVDVRLPRQVHLFSYSRRLRELCWDGVDLVHAWEEPYVFAGWQISRAVPRNLPFVFWTAQNLTKRYPPPFSFFERLTVRRANGWLACGHSIVAAMEHRPYYAQRPHQVAPLGVDIERFSRSESARAEVLRRLGWLDDGLPVLGYLGRLVPEKGLSVLMQCLDNVNTGFRALLIGSGPMERELRGWAARYPGRVQVLTSVRHDDVPRFLNAMDVLTAPSLTAARWREQFGRMLIEAMACGVPVVGSDSGEIPYVIGDAGVIVPEGDASAWSVALCEILESPNRRAALGEAGRTRVREKFAWNVVARQTLGFFDRLLEETPAKAARI